MPTSTEPRELSAEEIRDEFLGAVADLAAYWAKQPGLDAQKLADSVAYGVLRLITEGDLELPRFALVPDPHPEDKAYREGEGLNWCPPANLEQTVDITDGLYWRFQRLLEQHGRS